MCLTILPCTYAHVRLLGRVDSLLFIFYKEIKGSAICLLQELINICPEQTICRFKIKNIFTNPLLDNVVLHVRYAIVVKAQSLCK